jgi:hypothetical protein
VQPVVATSAALRLRPLAPGLAPAHVCTGTLRLPEQGIPFGIGDRIIDSVAKTLNVQTVLQAAEVKVRGIRASL